jgi:hypothetical protein
MSVVQHGATHGIMLPHTCVDSKSQYVDPFIGIGGYGLAVTLTGKRPKTVTDPKCEKPQMPKNLDLISR